MSKNNSEKKLEFFETILANIPVPMSISDYDGKILYINKSFERFYKRTGEQALGLKIEELYLAEDKDIIIGAVEKCRSEGYATCEVTTIKGDGKHMPVVLNFTLFKANGDKYIIATATDISDLKKREEELNFIFENSRAAMVLTDEKGRWIKINRAFCRDTGYAKEELLGKKLTEQPFTTEETIKALDKFRSYTIEKRVESKDFIDVPAKKKNGDTLIHSAFQVPYATGKGVLYTAIDVTKDRLNEKEYKRFVEDITYVAESLASGDYAYRVKTDYKNEDIKLTAETLNTVISYLEKSDDELQSLIKELATPSLEVMDKVVVMPLVGKLTSDRALDAMERILEKIEEIKAYAAIIDITGVPTIDSAVADNLIKTIEAIRLVGATPILSGVSANAAKNLVRIGVKFDFVTKGSLSEAINYV
ncbi:MAG: PAS domain S-box protein, partial [Deferribacterota bacterium]|nr:PAS domain S-box protein [Deferribacterota bacterium]